MGTRLTNGKIVPCAIRLTLSAKTRTTKRHKTNYTGIPGRSTSHEHYRLKGTYRQQNAVGKMENFTRAIEAETPLAAMDNNRAELYATGYDHILHMGIEVRTGKNTWKNIPMLKALELE